MEGTRKSGFKNVLADEGVELCFLWGLGRAGKLRARLGISMLGVQRIQVSILTHPKDGGWGQFLENQLGGKGTKARGGSRGESEQASWRR